MPKSKYNSEVSNSMKAMEGRHVMKRQQPSLHMVEGV